MACDHPCRSFDRKARQRTAIISDAGAASFGFNTPSAAWARASARSCSISKIAEMAAPLSTRVQHSRSHIRPKWPRDALRARPQVSVGIVHFECARRLRRRPRRDSLHWGSYRGSSENGPRVRARDPISRSRICRFRVVNIRLGIDF